MSLAWSDAGALHMDIRGHGETLVMLHGWGMHTGIWRELADDLSMHFRVVCIDLPGHGRSSAVCPLQLEAVARQVLLQVSMDCHWFGWSMGASILMQLMAMAPGQVKSMTLLAANPAFVRQQQWSHGIDAQVLAAFADDLQADYKKTLQKFIALQTLGSAQAREALKQLRAQIFEVSAPRPQALLQGLDILLQGDLRAVMEQSDRPCLVILGERDQLVPVSIADFYRALACRPQVEVIAGAGHAPFLTHRRQVKDMILGFIGAVENAND